MAPTVHSLLGISGSWKPPATGIHQRKNASKTTKHVQPSSHIHFRYYKLSTLETNKENKYWTLAIHKELRLRQQLPFAIFQASSSKGFPTAPQPAFQRRQGQRLFKLSDFPRFWEEILRGFFSWWPSDIDWKRPFGGIQTWCCFITFLVRNGWVTAGIL